MTLSRSFLLSAWAMASVVAVSAEGGVAFRGARRAQAGVYKTIDVDEYLGDSVEEPEYEFAEGEDMRYYGKPDEEYYEYDREYYAEYDEHMYGDIPALEEEGGENYGYLGEENEYDEYADKYAVDTEYGEVPEEEVFYGYGMDSGSTFTAEEEAALEVIEVEDPVDREEGDEYYI
jgi:hypothetical protein